MRSVAEFVIASNRNINNNACELYGWWLLASGGWGEGDCLSAELLSSLCCSIKEENLLINRAEAVKRGKTKKTLDSGGAVYGEAHACNSGLNPDQAAVGVSVYCIINRQCDAVGGAFAILPFAPTCESVFL